MLFKLFLNNMEKTLVFSITSLRNCFPLLAGYPTAGLSIRDHTCTLHQDLSWIFSCIKLAFTYSTEIASTSDSPLVCMQRYRFLTQWLKAVLGRKGLFSATRRPTTNCVILCSFMDARFSYGFYPIDGSSVAGRFLPLLSFSSQSFSTTF